VQKHGGHSPQLIIKELGQAWLFFIL